MNPSSPPLPPECDEVVVSAEAIAQAVGELGDKLTSRYQGLDLRLITVLRGGIFFLADLCRAVDVSLQIDFLAVQQFRPGGGGVRVTKDLADDIRGAHVVLVEDVVDTGLTLNYVLTFLRSHEPASLAVCALFDKPVRRIAEVPVDYAGIELDGRFFVGYGLDLRGRYRNLPYLAAVRDEVVYG
jgi:hypoxanthine phosphoribosyltransferase